LFPKGWYNEVQVQTVVLSADGENDSGHPEHHRRFGVFVRQRYSLGRAAGRLRVGRIKGQFVANPTHSQMLESDLDIIYVGNTADMVMYEGAAKEIVPRRTSTRRSNSAMNAASR
jgi:polyribonucleotide nucleotidyltransferase